MLNQQQQRHPDRIPYFAFALIIALWIQVSPASSDRFPELEVLNEAGNSRGNRTFVESMGEDVAIVVLEQAMRFTTRLLRVSPSGKRKIALIISTLPVDETASTTAIDDMSAIEISQQHLAAFEGDVTRELEGIIYEQMTSAWINGIGDAPPGILPGIAKFVRLKAGLAPENQFDPEQFVTNTDTPWEVGSYATAYFLVYLERIQPGFVAWVYNKMADGWNQTLTSEIDIDQLWQEWKLAPHPSPQEAFCVTGSVHSIPTFQVSVLIFCLIWFGF